MNRRQLFFRLIKEFLFKIDSDICFVITASFLILKLPQKTLCVWKAKTVIDFHKIDNFP